jgi:hypothetical protein
MYSLGVQKPNRGFAPGPADKAIVAKVREMVLLLFLGSLPYSRIEETELVSSIILSA